MSRLWRAKTSIVVGAHPAQALAGIAPGTDVTAILSSHHARYALLPWSENLSKEAEWQAYAAYRFKETYGAAAAEWQIRVSPQPKGAARVACGVAHSLLEELRAATAKARARLLSVQPGLMHAFNVRRREFQRSPGWLVVAEQGRLVLGLIADGLWRLVRVRNVGGSWREELPELLRREETLARRETAVDRVVLQD